MSMSEPASPHVEVAAYLLGKLEADEAERFEAHLEGCADCRRHLEELGGLPALLAQAAPADAPRRSSHPTLAAVGIGPRPPIGSRRGTGEGQQPPRSRTPARR